MSGTISTIQADSGPGISWEDQEMDAARGENSLIMVFCPFYSREGRLEE